MKPCPDCAHTDHPGEYWGLSFEREACRTCKGSATVGESDMRTYDADKVALSFAGVTLKPGQFVVGFDPAAGPDRSSVARGHIEAGRLVIDTRFSFKAD